MGEARPSAWPKVLLGLGLAVLILVGGGFVGITSLFHRYQSNVDHQVLLDPSAREGTPLNSWFRRNEPMNFLLLGSDLRAGQPAGGERSDTIIIVQVNGDRNAAHLVSIPRDLMVDIPRFEPTGFGGAHGKINSAFQFGGAGNGGVQLLSATLAKLTGVKFDGAAVINFNGFERVIDMLGGVEVCVDTEIQSIHTGRVFTRGCHVMSGAEALDYSRQRYGLATGDYGRQRHNQQLLKAIFATAISKDVVFNPTKIDGFLRALGDSMTVDTGEDSVTDVALAMRGLRSESLVGVAVPSHPEVINGESCVVMDGDAASLFEAMQDADLDKWIDKHPQWVHHI